MFTAIYNWVQKFLSIKPQSLIARAWQNRRSRIICILALGLPTIAVFVLTVLLPAAYAPLSSITETLKTESNAKASNTIVKAAEPIPSELAEKIVALKSEEAYWQARLKLAKTNSMQ